MFHRAACLLAAALALAACTDDEALLVSGTDAGSDAATDGSSGGSSGAAGASGSAGSSGGAGSDGGAGQSGNATFKVEESVQQLFITHADPGLELAVDDASGTEVQKATTDDLGSLIFR